MSDYIDRRAAIDAICNACGKIGCDKMDKCEKLQLPPANCSEIPNGSDDTISRQAAIDALARMMPRSYTPDGSHPADEEIFRAQEVFADCIEALEILPSEQPEIIRCKDCKFAHITNDRRYCKLCDMFTDDYGQLIEMYFDSNFYCGYAERRTDG